jgi:single-strand DNA-binding protein
MEHIFVKGNLTRDPETREAGSSSVCSFRLAANGFARGEKTTRFYDVSVWGRRGETAQQHLEKGQSVIVHGDFSVREFEHNGEQRTSLEVGNADFDFAGGNGEGGSQGGSQGGSHGGSQGGSVDNDDDDIQF